MASELSLEPLGKLTALSRIARNWIEGLVMKGRKGMG